MINSGAFANERPAEPIDEYSTTSVLPLSSLEDIASHLVRLNNEETRTPLIIFDQFDDYQARNRERFLPNKTWLNAAALRRENSFWEMVASLLEKEKLRTLFITRSDTAAGLNSVQFLGPIEALRLDRVPSQYITELLTRLTEGTPSEKIIADPEFGWNCLRDRIIRDISQQDVVLPQQLKIMLGGIQSLIRPIAEAINSAGNRYFAEILAIFAPRLKPEDLRAVANSIMEAAKDAKPPIQVGALAPALAAVASRSNQKTRVPILA